jgi:prophage tail gpP-like protein
VPYASDTVGDTDDRVRLVLGTDEVLIAESWDVHEGILVQPSAFTIELGNGAVAADLLGRYPPGTIFRLYVGTALQFTGWTDSRGLSQGGGHGTTVRFRGRDALAALESSDIVANLTLNNPTYPEIVWKALQLVGLAPATPLSLTTTGGVSYSTAKNSSGRPILATSNAANRSIKAGVKVIETSPVETVADYLANGSLGTERVAIQGKVSEKWHGFVRKYLDRAGLFLWAAADGTFVLSQPNAGQRPTYQIVRTRDGNTSNVTGCEFDEDATHRHSTYTIYGRGGGRKHGPSKAKGAFDDLEMQNVYGLTRPGAIHDAVVQSASEAQFLARRKLAEERRSGWRLSYTFSGHRLPLVGGSGESAIVVPDTVVKVDDEELGISQCMYVETVRRRRGPGTTTEVHLMRPIDLIFGDLTDIQKTGTGPTVKRDQNTTSRDGARVFSSTKAESAARGVDWGPGEAQQADQPPAGAGAGSPPDEFGTNPALPPRGGG